MTEENLKRYTGNVSIPKEMLGQNVIELSNHEIRAGDKICIVRHNKDEVRFVFCIVQVIFKEYITALLSYGYIGGKYCDLKKKGLAIKYNLNKVIEKNGYNT